MSKSPRKDASSLRGAEPKTKGKGRSRRPSSPDKNTLPFLEEDEFSNVTISVGDKKIYTNSCLLSYNSPVFMKMLSGDKEGKDKDGGGKGGKPGKANASSGGKDKELDIIDYSYEDVCEMIAFIDPRVETDLTDEVAARLLPLAAEYEINEMLKACSKTLTDSFVAQRKGRRPGYISTDTTFKYLKLADKYDCDKLRGLQDLCIEEFGANNNPHISKVIAEDDDLLEQTKRKVLQKRLDLATMALARERRTRTEQSEVRKSNIWKK